MNRRSICIIYCLPVPMSGYLDGLDVTILGFWDDLRLAWVRFIIRINQRLKN
jgi:hypothetical protein